MKKLIFGVVLALLALLCGCGTSEVENNAFPMAVGVEPAGTGDFKVYMAYPNLQSPDAKENALSSDLFWTGSAEDLFAGADAMSENSNKNVDFNHMKTLLLDRKVLEEEQGREKLISFFMENRDAAWNTYVMLTDGDLDKLFSEKLSLDGSLGIYLEDMLEEWTNVRSGAKTTVGDLVGQYYHSGESALIPVVQVMDGAPILDSFAVVKDLRCVCFLDRGRAYEAMLLKNHLKAFSFVTRDGVRVSLHLISAERRIREVSDAQLPEEQLPLLETEIRAVAQIKNRLDLSEAEGSRIRRQAEAELEERLSDLAVALQERYHVDAADSFLLLPGYNRNLWRRYASNEVAYEKKLRYRVEVELSRGGQSA